MPPHLPRLAEGEGLVLIGRPALFGTSASRLITELTPPLLYRFRSDDPSAGTAYRTIAGPAGPVRESEPFNRQRESGREDVEDCAIVYTGWKSKSPILILAGTSTAGTWGAAQYAASAVEEVDDVRWQCEIQGVLRTSVSARREAFEEVVVEPLQLVAPVRIWMQGADLPPWNGWRAVAQTRGRVATKGRFDLQIIVNGKEVCEKAATFIPALIMLAWIHHPKRRRTAGGYYVTTTTGEIKARLDAFFGGACVEGSHINATLKSLTDGIRAAGGIAFVKKDGRNDHYCMYVREPPQTLASWDAHLK